MMIALGLLAALMLAAILGLVIALRRAHQGQAAMRDYYEEQASSMRRRCEALEAIYPVLNETAGGLVKRIAESADTVATIHRLFPEAFKTHSGLLFWLYANDQFLVRLAELAAPEMLDSIQVDCLPLVLHPNREDLFLTIYRESGLDAPLR